MLSIEKSECMAVLENKPTSMAVSTNVAEIPVSLAENMFRTDFRGDFVGDAILSFPLYCTVCEIHLDHESISPDNFHSFLGVLVCKQCHDIRKTLTNSNISTPVRNDSFHCQWCAISSPKTFSERTVTGKTTTSEGKIFHVCSCSLEFCDECVQKHAPESINVNDQRWICFKCDCRPLWSLRAICDLVFSNKAKMEKLKIGKTVGQNNEIQNETRNVCCIVCLDGEATTAFTPCGHMCLCSTCVPTYKKSYKSCPMCRRIYRGTLRVYFE